MLTKFAKITTYYALRSKNLKRPHRAIAALLTQGRKIWEVELPSNVYTMRTPSITNPKSKIAVIFEGGEKKCGLEPSKWYVMVNDRLFARLSYKDVGISTVRAGLKAMRDDHLIIYLKPMKPYKEDRELILKSLSKQLT